MIKGIINRLIMGFAAGGAALVTVIALGATIFYGLSLVVIPVAAAAITALIFAVVAGVLFAALSSRSKGRSDDEEEDEGDHEDEGLAGRAMGLFRSRPILASIGALAAGLVVLRNPALATLAAAALGQKPRHRHRRRY